jgi:hypothetical protein
MTTEAKPEGLALLREPFPPNLISKLPKPTKAQTEAVKADFKKGIRCTLCGSWHAPDVVHLDYVGHAALTDRLLDADPQWSWQPVALDANGLPAFDQSGGLWIKLTVCGVTRFGYGHAAAKNADPGAREKEVIGDALRNAAMRFGAALDLWHKGDLHEAEEARGKPADVAAQVAGAKVTPTSGLREQLEPGQLQKVERTASSVIDCFENGDVCTALNVIEEAKLDTDEKAALWTFFDSKMRRALKTEAESRKRPALVGDANHVATQA